MNPDGLEQRGSERRLRVLVFEDCLEDAELSIHSLRSAGFDVHADVVVSLERLAAQLRAQSYDVVISDYRMPNANGMEAFELTRRCSRHTPFVLVTGALGDEMAVECLKQGVSDYVLKGSLARLPSAVSRALGEKRLRGERALAVEALRRSEEQLRDRNRELEEQNHRVEAASRMKSEFLANMSHELRSPLNGIIGFGQIIFDGKLGPLNIGQTQSLSRILSCAQHLLRLINDILDVAKIEAGKLTFEPEPVSVSELIAEACNSQPAIAEAKGIRISQQIDHKINTTIDPARFKQIVYNYLSNALKFTPEGGQVIVRLTRDRDGALRLEITDTGCGIPESDLPSLFTEFHQLDSGKAKKYQGAGLGLALTKRLVEAQGGTVGVRSALGTGSTFYAVLPCQSKETESKKEAE